MLTLEGVKALRNRLSRAHGYFWIPPACVEWVGGFALHDEYRHKTPVASPHFSSLLGDGIESQKKIDQMMSRGEEGEIL